MTEQAAEIVATIKEFVLAEFLPGEDPDALDENTPLISNAILDSVATVKLVTFLEERFGVEFEPHEMSIDYLNTLADIAATVQTKVAAKG